MALDRGAVVWVNTPEHGRHPGVVLDVREDAVYVAMGTGHGNYAVTARSRKHVLIDPTRSARIKRATGLSKPTYFYGDRIMWVQRSAAGEVIGRCPMGDVADIRELALANPEPSEEDLPALPSDATGTAGHGSG